MAETLVLSKSAVFLLALCAQILFTDGRPIKSSMNKHGSDHTVSFHQRHIPNTAFGDSATSKDDFRPTSPGVSPGVGHPREIVTGSSLEHSVAEFKDDHRATKTLGKIKGSETTPYSHIPQAVARKDEQMSSPGTTIHDFSAFAADAFRPTDPGNSPGVGHHLSQEESDEETDPKPPRKDYGPKPGHSHPVGRDIIFSNPSNTKGSQPASSSHIPVNAVPLTPTAFDASAASSMEGFRPTTPGYSPGVGHPNAEISSSNVETSVTKFEDDHRPTQPGHSPGVGHAYHENNAEPNP